ncbi:MAG TPA: BlaI/MecI/CopY family transcriptional regulator [Candidatus Eisenbacteria bacterium]|nr:BlaI/MecI/CopY family transcriptional regulator [Candidatus Eisenbacteria bacterium]
MKDSQRDLTRRERQIMDVIYARGRATVAEVLEGLADPPSYSSVRTLLRLLEEKGHLRHEESGPRFVYIPTVAREKARRSALRNVLDTFFAGSTEDAMAALLDLHDVRRRPLELDRIKSLIDNARREGR